VPRESSNALAEFERRLAASLAGRGEPPPGCDPEAVAHARIALVAKRRQVAVHLLRRTVAVLGEGWVERFGEHARSYLPQGLLYHVDDAWALARELVTTASSREVRRAAHADLVALRLRYARDPQATVHRIRERRSPLLALVRTPDPFLVLRLPGSEARVFWLRLGSPRVNRS